MIQVKIFACLECIISSNFLKGQIPGGGPVYLLSLWFCLSFVWPAMARYTCQYILPLLYHDFHIMAYTLAEFLYKSQEKYFPKSTPLSPLSSLAR
jgi:hypothetical protein